MRKRYNVGFYLFLLLAGAVIFCHSGFVAAEGFQQLSSDVVSRAGAETQRSKIYVSGDKMRTEVADNIMIIRLDKSVTWMVMVSEQMYMEQSIDRKMVPQTSKEMQGEIERVLLGNETIDGIQTQKFKVTYQQGNKQETIYQWLMDSGFPIKMEAVDGSWSVEYKNISFGPQPDSLFEVPAGFQKVSMPFGGGSGAPSLEDIMSKMNE